MTIIRIGYETYATEKDLEPYEFGTIMSVLRQLHRVRNEWHEQRYRHVAEPERLTCAVELNAEVLSKEAYEAMIAPKRAVIVAPATNGIVEPQEVT